jgi:hypothetical protein
MVGKLHAIELHMTRFNVKKYSAAVKPEEFRAWNDKMIQKFDPDAFHHHSSPVIRFIEIKRVRAILKLMDEHSKEGRSGEKNPFFLDSILTYVVRLEKWA